MKQKGKRYYTVPGDLSLFCSKSWVKEYTHKTKDKQKQINFIHKLSL
jgi:hypothetical protein